MKRVAFATAVLLCVTAAVAVADEARLMRYPDIYGDQVVFVYAGDLWTVSAQGGIARKLTTNVGMEASPKFSPDGKLIAFTSDYDGNTDVFVIPAVGGEPKRLTFHPDPDLMVDWYPDGKSILFRSTRLTSLESPRYNRLFKVPVEGGYVEALPLPTGELASFNADASKIAYNRMSREFRTWKRYRGGMAQDIWIYDFAKNELERITDFEGTDAFPMWHGDKIYFVSDRAPKSVMNLYSYDLNTKEVKQLTSYDEYDVQWPSLGDGKIIYMNGGWLYVFDLATEQPRKLSVEIFDDKILARPTIENVQGYIHSYDISPSGARAVFGARGDIFTVPAKKGDIRNLTNTPGIRERAAVWSPDGKWIAYFSDATGEYELYIRAADGSGEVKQLTEGSAVWYDLPVWSPDSKKIMFSDVGVNIFYIDIESKKVTKVVHGQNEATTNFITGVWSPDSKWIAYNIASENGFSSIYLYSLEQAKSFKITSDMTDDNNPVFDPDGKYLYWIANRQINFTTGYFDEDYILIQAGRIVVATLQAGEPSPFIPESDEEKVKEEKKEGEEKKAEGGEKKAEEKKAEEKKAEEEKALKIDIDGIEGRIIDIPVPDGDYIGLVAASGKLFFAELSRLDNGIQGATLKVFDMQKREAKDIVSGVRGAAFSADGKKLLYRQGPNFFIVDAAPGVKPGDGMLNLSGLEMTVDPKAEWKQIFTDAWRQARDWFYDPNHHGVDWNKIKERYGQMLPYVAHRDDLNYLIGEMIAELNSSHTYRGGGDYPQVKRIGVGLLACDLVPDKASGYYKIAKIYTGMNWDPSRRGPLAQPGLKVKEGDYLIAVNGEELRYPANPYAPFVNTVDKVVKLKVNSEPKAEGATEIEVTPVANDRIHRYLDWIEGNRLKVDKATGGRVGYIHLPDTAEGGMEFFNRMLYPQIRKDALIVDVRYNSGGFIPSLYMNHLARQLLNGWATRYTNGFLTPFAAHFGPKICIANSYAGSGGDAFPYYFKKMKLGKLIGTRTWGGLIGLSGNPPLMDNGGVVIADFSFYNTEGQWDVESHGVDPDVEVDDLPNLVVAGHDPCLEKAIELIMEDLKNLPKKPIPEQPKTNPVR
jgi:tricorn protease